MTDTLVCRYCLTETHVHAGFCPTNRGAKSERVPMSKKNLTPYNINYHVRVKLTDKGRDELKRLWEDVGETSYPPKQRAQRVYTPKEEDADGWSRWQLWTLMATFGHMMLPGLGDDNPFEPEILLEDGE